jgi:hypothetical protein
MEREPQVGDCVVVTRNNGSHPARIGDRYIVHHVDDDDSTLRGMLQGSSTLADYWLPWGDVEPVVFGWQYARRHLPPELIRLLSACDGIETIALNRRIKELIIDSLPDWKDRVLVALEATETIPELDIDD